MTDFTKDPIMAKNVVKVPCDHLALPEGYTIKLDQHGMGWHVYKHDRVLRRQKKTSSDSPGQPMWFKDDKLAKEYAHKHAEQGLEAGQEVPN